MYNLPSYLLVFVCLLGTSVLGIEQKYVPQAHETIDQKKAKIEAFVDSAKRHIEDVGIEQARLEFGEHDGRFSNLSDGGDQYIEVLKMDGTVLAHPFSDAVGKNYWDWQYPQDTFPTQQAVSLAQKGGGWHIMTLPHPHTSKEVTRYEYIHPHHDAMIMSGFYVDS